MTMVFSAGTDKFLVMANDSAIERVGFPEGPEYDTDAKAFCCDGVGVVTMWGARDGNQLIRHLRDLHDKSPLRTIDHLAQEVFRYLTKEYQPHEREGGCVDTGYHVGGFTDSGQVRLYQIAWNRPGSGVARSNQGAYVMELHHPNQEMRALYNGRSDIVDPLIIHLITEITMGRELRFPIRTPSGMCRFAHFVLRVGSELTKQVGEPLLVHVLSPSKRCIQVLVDPDKASDNAVFAKALTQAGLS